VVLSHQEPYINPLLHRAHHSILCTLAYIQCHQLHHYYSHFHHYSTILSFRMLVILTSYKPGSQYLNLISGPSHTPMRAIHQWESPIDQCTSHWLMGGSLAYGRLGGKIRKYVSGYSVFRLSFNIHTNLLLVIQMPSF
jgi:hypothetical protein